VLLFTDADDIVVPGWLAAHAAALDSATFTTGPLIPIPPRATTVSPELRGAPRALVHMHYLPYAFGTNFGVRRDAFVEAGWFREDRRTGEDVDLSWRLQEEGSELVYVVEARVGRRPTSGTRHVLRQYFQYGRTDPFLYTDHRAAGVPPQRFGEVWRSYAGLVLRLFVLFDATQRERWMHQAGRRAGRLVGSVQARTVYL
jgi:GT2 family glycosyltransferase